MGLKTKFGDLPALVTAKLLPSSPDIRVGTNAAGDCYVGVSRSRTGVIYYQSDENPEPKQYVSGTSTSSCTNLQTLINPMLLAGGPGGATPVVNLATNPSFETAAAQTTIRTNLAVSPYPSGTRTWRSNNDVPYPSSLDTDFVRRPGTKSVRSDKSASTPNTVIGSWYAVGTGAWAPGQHTPVTAGQTYTISTYFASDQANTKARQAAWWFGAGGADLGYTWLPDDQPGLAPGEWGRVADTVVAPPDAVEMGILVTVHQSATTVGGEKAWIQDTLVEQTSTVGPYFDGSTAAAGDFAYAWSSTANASRSVQRAPGLPGEAGASRSVIQQSSEWKSSGTKSMKVIPDQVGTYDGVMLNIPLAVGKTYTFTATVRTTASTRINFAPDGIGVNTSPTMAAGETRTFTLTGVANRTTLNGYIRAIDPGSAPFYVDDVTVVEGTYTGPFFDGGTNGAYWLGTPHGSQSLRY
jgi:hypothetical protein